MLKIKKIGLGTIFVLLFSVTTLFFGGHKALAAGGPINGAGEWRSASYTINQSSTVIVNLAGNDHDNINFNVTGSNPKIYSADTNGTGVCSGQITLSGSLSDHPTIKASISVKFEDSSGPTPTCTDGGNGNYSNSSIGVTNNTSKGGQTSADTGPTTITYNGQTYHQVSTGNGTARAYGLSQSIGSNCYSGSLLILKEVDSKANAPVQGTILDTTLSPTSSGQELSSQADVPAIPLSVATVGKCMYGGNGDNIIVNVDASGKATFASCSKGDSACKPAASTPPPAAPTVQPNSCETDYTGAAKEFNWIFCAALRGVDGIVNFLDGQIQGYLFLCTGTSQTTGETCSTNLLPTHVYQVWSIFRILATSLLVVILLVMVIAQAMGGAGPIDAYTIRKILPRVVIAAIFMQISWYVFKYVIDISNDAGKGIANLMFYPFGGAGSFSLDNLVGGAGKFAPGITVGAAGITTAALIAFGGLTTIGWMFLGVSLVASLFTGLLVLVIRQLIVIMCMMIVPLALVAWILPGTKRYWDMWKDNFTKVLFMFPMIMAMIAGGRIFAYLGSQQGGFTGLIIVLGGYFFPYFYLPKTFKWGGQAFGAISSGVWQGTQKYRAAPGKLALQEAKGNREQRAMDRAERLANNRGRTFDRLFAGHYNYLRGSTTREHHYQDVLEKGRKAADEAAARSVIGSEYERMDHPDKVATDILVAQGRLDPRTGMDGRHAATQRAALDRLAKYGDWDAIAAVREGGYMGEEGERVWQDFVAKNISAIHQNMPHLSPQRTNLSQVAYREFQSMKDDGWDEVLRQASTGQNRDGASGLLVPSADPEGDRRRFVEQARRALDDTQFMASVGAHGRAVLEQVARMPVLSPEVQLVGGGRTGGPSRVYLPDATAFGTPATASTAIDSVRQNMFSAQPGVAEATRRELARAVGSGTLSVPERDAYENLLSELKVEATHSTTARSVYNATISGVNDELSARVRRAEQQAIAGGLTPAQISAARSGAQAAASNDRARMVANGLTPY